MGKIKFLFFLCFAFCAACGTSENQGRDLSIFTLKNDPLVKSVPDSLKYLVPILLQVLRDDQKFRSEELYTKNLTVQDQLDSGNLVIVRRILDRYGWLGFRDVGIMGNRAITSTMVHSDAKTKLKYYQVMLEGLKKASLFASDAAMFEDKMNLQLRRQQFYGTQMTKYEGSYIPYPVFEPDSLDARRVAVNLGPMDEYIKLFARGGWDLQEYKKILPALIKHEKTKDSPGVHTDLKLILKERRKAVVSSK